MKFDSSFINFIMTSCSQKLHRFVINCRHLRTFENIFYELIVKLGIFKASTKTNNVLV